MPAFHHALGFFQDDVGNLDVAFRRLVEGGGNNFRPHAARHVGHLFRAFVYQKDDEIYFGMVGGNGIGNFLQKDRLTGFGLCYNQAALPLADGGEYVHYAGGQGGCPIARDVELLVGEKRSQMVEGDAVAHSVRRLAVDFLHFNQGEIFFSFFRRAHGAHHRIAGLQAEKLDLAL